MPVARGTGSALSTAVRLTASQSSLSAGRPGVSGVAAARLDSASSGLVVNVCHRFHRSLSAAPVAARITGVALGPTFPSWWLGGANMWPTVHKAALMEAPCVSLITRICTRVWFSWRVRHKRVTATSSMTDMRVAEMSHTEICLKMFEERWPGRCVEAAAWCMDTSHAQWHRL